MVYLAKKQYQQQKTENFGGLYTFIMDLLTFLVC